MSKIAMEPQRAEALTKYEQPKMKRDARQKCSLFLPCLKWMKLGCQVLLGHFGPVYLLQVSKNDDEKRCLLE